jgi:hypothetical protein
MARYDQLRQECQAFAKRERELYGLVWTLFNSILPIEGPLFGSRKGKASRLITWCESQLVSVLKDNREPVYTHWLAPAVRRMSCVFAQPSESGRICQGSGGLSRRREVQEGVFSPRYVPFAGSFHYRYRGLTTATHSGISWGALTPSVSRIDQNLEHRSGYSSDGCTSWERLHGWKPSGNLCLRTWFTNRGERE